MAVKPGALYSCLIEDLCDALSCSEKALLDLSDGEYSHMTYRQFACRQLLNSFYKKLVESKGVLADEKAIDKFLAINNRCGTWSRENETSLFMAELRGHFKQEMHKFFEPDNRGPLVSGLSEILHFAGTGPGAAIGAIGNDFYTKLFSSNLSCTSRVLEVAYTSYIQASKLWSDAEKFRLATGYGFDIVSGNRLALVPKNVDISRTICIEPNLNMFIQLGLGRILEKRLKSNFGIDLSAQQEVNRALAKEGSEFNDLCTIDLESASDSISMRMLEEYVPRDFLVWLKLLRSNDCRLPDGRLEKLNMVSTMGNGFTFPLQTAIFACIVRACESLMSSKYPFKGNKFDRDRARRVSPSRAGNTWSVFGDDIIVPRVIVGPVTDLLAHLGFLVNMRKSFFEGPFRESCGRDFFLGRDVRGVYIKSLSTLQSRYVAINLLNRWSALTGIWLPRTVQMLLRSVRYQPVPPWENDDAGIKVPFSMVDKLRLDRNTQSVVYTRSVSKPKRITIVEGELKGPRGTKRRIYNPDGLFLAFLRGDIENGRISIRHGVNTYRPRRGYAPSWDHSPTVSVYESGDLRLERSPPVFATEVDRQRWETAVHFNFEVKPGN
jgi:hypothetical protein